VSYCSGEGCTYPSHLATTVNQVTEIPEATLTVPVAPPESSNAIIKAEKPKPRQNFSQWFFPSKQEKAPKSTHVVVEKNDGTKETLPISEYKKAMRLFFTVRRDVVPYCNHKIDLNSPPKNNCHACWFAWFNNHGELVKELDKAFQEHGGEIIEMTRGRKFLVNFLKFMGTLAKWKAEAEAAGQTQVDSAVGEQVNNVESTGRTEGSGEIANAGTETTGNAEAA
jgi:hypothetical protein